MCFTLLKCYFLIIFIPGLLDSRKTNRSVVKRCKFTASWLEELKFISRMSKRKTPSADNNPNFDFCEFLTELADYEKNVNRNIFKSNAYRKAAAALAKQPTRVVSGKEALAVEGVGKAIATKIDEFLQTGKLKKLEAIREDSTAKNIGELTRVSGIGPAKARELNELGISSIDQLREHEDLLNHHQSIGLRYLEDFEKRIPRCDVEQYESVLKKTIHNLDPQFKLTVCGSYRRGRPECGDIDVLLTHPNFVSSTCPKEQKKSSTLLLKKVVEHLQNKSLVAETLAFGDVKYMGTTLLNGVMRRLDMRLTPHDQYYCAVLYFTGSDVFNQNMRKHALAMNFTLNEYTLRRIGETVSEHLKFTMKYLLPTLTSLVCLLCLSEHVLSSPFPRPRPKALHEVHVDLIDTIFQIPIQTLNAVGNLLKNVHSAKRNFLSINIHVDKPEGSYTSHPAKPNKPSSSPSKPESPSVSVGVNVQEGSKPGTPAIEVNESSPSTTGGIDSGFTEIQDPSTETSPGSKPVELSVSAFERVPPAPAVQPPYTRSNVVQPLSLDSGLSFDKPSNREKNFKEYVQRKLAEKNLQDNRISHSF